MGFYEGIRDNTVTPLVKKFGKQMILRRSSPGVYDATAGEVSGATTTDYRCWGVFKRIDLKRIDGTLIQRNDKLLMVVMENQTVTPCDSTDSIVIGTEVLKIISNDTLAPGGVDIMHNLQVRR